MKFARFWTRDVGEATTRSGRRFRVSVRGWSDESMAEAHNHASDLARRVAEWVAAHPGKKNHYDIYGDRPVPEPIVHDLRGTAGQAAITRNSFGALVLNTERMMFVDIDREDPKPRIFSFGARKTVLEAVRDVAERRGVSARVYKTTSGHRAIITDRPFQPASPESESLLKEFGSDELYIRLCRVQKSFRARLTPKPWRCDFRKPPAKFPFETSQAQSDFRKWEAEYSSRTSGYATCNFLGGCGQEKVLPEFQELVHLHDRETKSASGLPLA